MKGNALLRLGLISAGLTLLNLGADLWAQGNTSALPWMLGLSFVVWAGGSLLLLLASIDRLDPRWLWLILIAFLAFQSAHLYLQQLNATPLTTSRHDNEMVAEFATQALADGYNPYEWNFSDMLRVYRDRGLLLTPLLDGSGQNRLTYSALPTLMLWALDGLGLGQPRALSFVFQTLLLCLMFVGSPPELRPIVLLPLLLFRGFIFLGLNGTQDVGWSTMLVAMILMWRRPTLRAILFGLACAFRQQPWFIAPFLLIHLWNGPSETKDKRKAVMQFALISGGVFLIINAPFIVWNFPAWASGTFEPLYAPFNVISEGIAVVSQYGLLPLPRQFYTILQASSLLLMLVAYWRHPLAFGQAFWIFPGIFFWLHYRGLPNYWVYWIPPLIMAIVTNQLRFATHVTLSDAVPPKISGDIESLRRGQKAPSLLRMTRVGTEDVAILLLLVNLLLAAAFTQFAPIIDVNVFLPMETVDAGQPMVARIKLLVTNRTEVTLQPRFAAQRDPGLQPFPWQIDSGPEQLQPGEAEEYVISTDALERMFPASGGGLVVVTDASGDYRLRAICPILPDTSFIAYDPIANPDFRFWANGTGAPESWRLQLPKGAPGAVLAGTQADQFGLALSVTAEKAGTGIRLTQTITFPDSFKLWVYPISNSVDPREEAYGVEFTDAEHTLWVLFGESKAQGWLSNGHAFIYQRAPLNTWSLQSIDLPKLYTELGWRFPPFSLRHRNGVEYAARQITMSLLVSSETRAQIFGWFGPIEQTLSPDHFGQEALTQPDLYYANLGDEYRRQRNNGLAEGAYTTALGYNADNLAAHTGLGWVLAERGQCAEAIPHFQQVLAVDDQLREAQEGMAKCGNGY